ncbi:hypothetical protein RIF29_36637 [Crotalaria pallida]|uniref:Uncharacterized protein n=1 Tax=Crotalaria pallida TaxID=3830 RepID=A0AAN9EHV7_CROPI
MLEAFFAASRFCSTLDFEGKVLSCRAISLSFTLHTKFQVVIVVKPKLYFIFLSKKKKNSAFFFAHVLFC